MEKSFCLEENQVEKLVQLINNELINLDVLIRLARLSDSVRLHLEDEKFLCVSILDVFFSS